MCTAEIIGPDYVPADSSYQTEESDTILGLEHQDFVIYMFVGIVVLITIVFVTVISVRNCCKRRRESSKVEILTPAGHKAVSQISQPTVIM